MKISKLWRYKMPCNDGTPKLFVRLSLVVLLFVAVHNNFAGNQIDQYDVVWESPSENSSGSMPVGNGDIGANVWVEQDGDILFYIGKTDAWSENCRLLKLGRVRIGLSPNPFTADNPFRQKLKLRDGEIVINAGKEGQSTELRFWVDANNPVIRVEINGDKPFNVVVKFENWRTHRRQLADNELHSAYGLHSWGPSQNPNDVFVEPDVLVSDSSNQIMWYHRNNRSIWKDTFELQGLGTLTQNSKDPLLNRTFGGIIKGNGLVNVNKSTLKSAQKSDNFNISVYPFTSQADSVNGWIEELKNCIESVEAVSVESARKFHQRWWTNFWQRSWVRVSGGDGNETGKLSVGWHLHRYLIACTARGNFPVKFNGSIFNVDGKSKEESPWTPPVYDADYRLWGGPYWFQNTRQIYWPMLAAGDFDLFKPLFKMYLDALPMAKQRTKIYYNHAGAFFPETMYFWGTYTNTDYGWDRTDKPIGLTENGFIRRYWQGGIELVVMMLDYYAYTEDREFVNSTLMPLSQEIVTFFDQHWQRDDRGKIRFDPAQALETLWDVENPLPEIAGLTRTLNGLLSLPKDLTYKKQRQQWQRMLNELPNLPIKAVDGKKYLDAAEIIKGSGNNVENVALYAVFPYQIYGVDKPNLEMLRKTYQMRSHRIYNCWCNDNVFAAYLGLASEARVQLAERFTRTVYHRFPVFYDTSLDWTPDHDNGGVSQQALQAMLIQSKGDKIYLFPAWPKEWDVDFNLYAAQNTIIQCVYRAGKIEKLNIKPESRMKDIVFSKELIGCK
jgi:alpha-L-fucosidase 2